MKACWPVSLSCEVLGVSVIGYFEHQRRQLRRRPSQRVSTGIGIRSTSGAQTHLKA